MPDENPLNDIGNPEPEDGDTLNWLTHFGGILVAATGGFLVFTFLVVPTRVRGATHSSKLKWQQFKEQEIAASVEATDSPTPQLSPRIVVSQPPAK